MKLLLTTLLVFVFIGLMGFENESKPPRYFLAIAELQEKDGRMAQTTCVRIIRCNYFKEASEIFETHIKSTYKNYNRVIYVGSGKYSQIGEIDFNNVLTK